MHRQEESYLSLIRLLCKSFSKGLLNQEQVHRMLTRIISHWCSAHSCWESSLFFLFEKRYRTFVRDLTLIGSLVHLFFFWTILHSTNHVATAQCKTSGQDLKLTFTSNIRMADVDQLASLLELFWHQQSFKCFRHCFTVFWSGEKTKQKKQLSGISAARNTVLIREVRG